MENCREAKAKPEPKPEPKAKPKAAGRCESRQEHGGSHAGSRKDPGSNQDHLVGLWENHGKTKGKPLDNGGLMVV